MNKSASIILSIVMIMVVAVVASAAANADNFGYTPGIDVLYVKVNGDEVTDNQTISTYLQRGQDLEITVKLRSYVNLTNVEVSTYLSGYEYNSDGDERISDVQELPEVDANVDYPVTLKIKLPDLVQTDNYKLRVSIADRNSALATFNYNLKVDAPTHEIEIKDVTLSPAESVKAGRSLIANVRLKNFGAQSEEDIKITAKVAELDGVEDTYYINEIGADESKSSEDLLLRIPMDAKPGVYTLKVEADYNNGHDKATDEVEFEVLKGDVAASGTSGTATTPTTPQPNTTTPTTPTQSNNVLINYDANTKVLTQGEGGAIYSVTIANQGATARSFVVDVSGVDWATVRMSPGNMVVVNPGESKAVYVYVSANEDASVGTHDISATIKSGSDVVGTAAFKADVVEAKASLNQTSFNSILTYLLVALVIVLVIVVIVLVVSRGKGPSRKQEGEFDNTQSYY